MLFSLGNWIGTRVKLLAPWFDHKNLCWQHQDAVGTVTYQNGPVLYVVTEDGSMAKIATVLIGELECK
jgi:hypothetical protein